VLFPEDSSGEETLEDFTLLLSLLPASTVALPDKTVISRKPKDTLLLESTKVMRHLSLQLTLQRPLPPHKDRTLPAILEILQLVETTILPNRLPLPLLHQQLPQLPLLAVAKKVDTMILTMSVLVE